MPERERIARGVIDADIILCDGEELLRKHVILQGVAPGRILFTESPCVRVEGNGVRIAHCLIEGTY